MNYILECIKVYFNQFGWRTYGEITAAFLIIIAALRHYGFIKSRKG